MKVFTVGCDNNKKYKIRDTEKPYKETPNEYSPGVMLSGGIIVSDPDTDAYIGHFDHFGSLLMFMANMRLKLIWVREE